MNMNNIKLPMLFIMCIVLSACLGMPKNMVPVNEFELERYLGQWYEIARLDHSFERGLEQVTANYSLRKDGGVSVINRGYSTKKEKWKTAEGKAYFVKHESEGYLKVSFFGPFYGTYAVFELDKKNYDYAFVSGPDLSYLWLLSRKPDVDKHVVDKFITMSKDMGFDTNQLIFVNHNEH